MFLIVIVAAAALAQPPLVPTPRIPRTPVSQPLPFSHKTHITAGAQCRQCHTMPEPGDFMLLPATKICMGCHESVKKDSPHIRTLATTHSAGKRVEWRAVYRIPEWVSFNHKQHLGVAGVNCETCHGAVAQRDVLAKEKEHNMQTCMECHRATNASNECIVCHDPR